MFQEWGDHENLDVHWLNGPSNPEVAFVYLAVSISQILDIKGTRNAA